MIRRLAKKKAQDWRSRLGVESLEARQLLAGDVIINEISAVNDTLLPDEDGDTPDWIELHNVGDEPVELTGWYLTDDQENLRQWRFPDNVNVGPGEFLIVYASGKDRADAAAVLHTNFRLSSDGEYLALVAADASTVVDVFSPQFPPQFSDVTYGRSGVEDKTILADGNSAARYVVATAELDGAIGARWTGGQVFDDADWSETTASLGFAQNPVDSTRGLLGTPAYQTPAGSSGNQAYSGRIGMDFVITAPITVTSLGVFDDGSDGLRSRVGVELWSRDDGGTPDDFRDDAGLELLASDTFRGTRDLLIGGSRYSELNQPLELQPGAYSIVAFGFTSLDRNAVGFAGGSVGDTADTNAIRFVGSARLGERSDRFPRVPDVGPANRYGAGSFTFLTADDIGGAEPAAKGEVIAYRSPAVAGNAATGSNLGVDFQVIRPITVTELGVFDSGQDGIAGSLGVSLWSRTTGELLAGRTFLDDAGALEEGTGTRFLPLQEPLLLVPGDYTVVASGFFGDDLYVHAERPGGAHGELNGSDGSITFEGTSRYNIYAPNRFAEEPHHNLPPMEDIGPVNRWSAGTFKYEVALLDHIESDVSAAVRDVSSSVYVRIPFDVAQVDSFAGLRLHVNYDDGFVTYLNGVEVARRNAPADIAWDATATVARADLDVLRTDVFDLSEHLPLLQPNTTNVLAFQVLNLSADDADVVLDPLLEAFADAGMVTGYFLEPTPGTTNADAFLGVVPDPEITTAGGIVDPARLNEQGELLVEITDAVEDAQIYVTTDGSEPSPAHGMLYTGAVPISGTTILRAAAVKDGFIGSGTSTATFILLDDVLAAAGVPADFPTHWNGEPPDYAISQDPSDLAAIAGDLSLPVDEARDVIKESLQSLPVMSIVGDIEDIFGLPSGLYTNPYPRGRDTEHPASVEYYEADGTKGFQIDAGLRMMGWTSRIPQVSPKHSLRLVFRSEYGAGRLEYPLFPDSDITTFDTLALRSNSRDTWISDYPFGPGTGIWDEYDWGAMRSVATYIRDQWSREVQADMGMAAAEGTFVHLYLNGVYWGVYNPTERPDGAFAADRFGGDEDDYDSITFCNPTSRATHGDLAAWRQLIGLVDDGLAGDAAYQRVLGNNPDGTRNPDFPLLLDIDNFIDFMISGQYDATDDWPCNFYALRERNQNDTGFQFLTWDNDLAIPLGEVGADRVDVDLGGTPKSSPWRLQAVLQQNSDYALKFADRVQQHFFHDGALTPAASAARWQRITDQIAPGMIAESARWGDYRRDVGFAGPAELYTKSDHWDVFNDQLLASYFPNRTDIVLGQMRARGLYPSLAAPELSQHGGTIEAGFDLSIDAPTGMVYYTLDGSDPREHVPNITLFNDNSVKRVLVPTINNGGSALGTSWTSPDFDHASWTVGRGGIGYELGTGDYFEFIGVDTRVMRFAFPSAYIRIPFNVAGDTLPDLTFLNLKMRYDDGFVAYLNGVEVARANAPSGATWNTLANGGQADGTALVFQDFDITQFMDQLQVGSNVLAIHGMNINLASSDFLIGAELVTGESAAGLVSATAQQYLGNITLDQSTRVKARVFDGNQWSALTEASFAVESPLRVSEIYFNPPGSNETTEFIELVNTGVNPVNLLGVGFVTDNTGAGIDFIFQAGDSVLSLDPGQHIVIAKDPAAFRAAYPDLPAEILVAERGFEGQLSNGGERLTLVDRGGSIIQEFRYDDDWYPVTDGDGYSLTIVDATADLAAWSTAEGWRSSSQIGGSPGTADAGVTEQILRQDAPRLPNPGGGLPMDRRADLAPGAAEQLAEPAEDPAELPHEPKLRLIGAVPLGLAEVLFGEDVMLAQETPEDLVVLDLIPQPVAEKDESELRAGRRSADFGLIGEMRDYANERFAARERLFASPQLQELLHQSFIAAK